MEMSGPELMPTGKMDEIIAATNYETRCIGDYALTQCFRPAGIAFDRNGALWVSSDSNGQIVKVIADSSLLAKNADVGMSAKFIVGSLEIYMALIAFLIIV